MEYLGESIKDILKNIWTDGIARRKSGLPGEICPNSRADLRRPVIP